MKPSEMLYHPLGKPEPCCGVPVNCEKPDKTCEVRERHDAQRLRGERRPGEVIYTDNPQAFTRAAIARQEGGSHYKDMAIQPVQYILANGIQFAEGSVIKYVSRWRAKGGVEDLKKARHFLDLLIEHEEGKPCAPR